MRSKDWNSILAGLLLAPVPFVAQAETYLTDSQAAAVFFPGVPMEARWVDLTPDQTRAIQKASGQKALSPQIRIWWGPKKEAMIVDRVLGKREFITYAVGISPEGKIVGVEIMDYQETYGYEIREKGWRQKFVGKDAGAPIKLDRDIPNISGATLSSKHVTDGVRRVMQTYEVLKSKA